MEKRVILAVALSILVFVVYIQFFTPPPPDTTKQPPITQNQNQIPSQTQSGSGEVPTSQTIQPTSNEKNRLPRLIYVDNGKLRLVFSELGGRLVSAELIGILKTKTDPNSLKQLVQIDRPDWKPLGVTTVKGSIPDLANALYTVEAVSDKLDASQKEAVITFRWTSLNGIQTVKRFTIKPQSYVFHLGVNVVNNSQAAIDDNIGLNLTAFHDVKEGGSYAFRGFGAFVNDKLIEESPDDLVEAKVHGGKTSWGGYENSYFLQAIVPETGQGSFKGTLLDAAKEKQVVEIRHTAPPVSIGTGGSASFSYDLFYGPKDIELLNRLGHNLDASINMGWFDIIAKPFLYFLRYCFDIFGNYGLAIIILTVCVKVVFFPLAQKSYKSMRRMSALQPQMAKLREKHKDDKQRLNQEMMGLYKVHKVNPMGGCLPMVVQIPVFIALYRLLDYGIELRHAPFLLWIQDLSAPDRLFRFGFEIPFMEPPYGIPVLTLLMGASMFIQQKMTPTPGDPTQAKIMLLMPVIFTFIFINFPAGLVLYWLVNNVLSIAQQVLVNRGK